MTWRSFQQMMAQLALLFVPWTAVNFGVAFTVGDVFLILAILLNVEQWLYVRRFQIPFFLAFLFAALSTFTDADVTLTRAVQTIYIWGLVLPFGWCAFTGLTLQRISQMLIISGIISATVAIGQGAGYIEPFENQFVYTVSSSEFSRAGGFSLQSNELALFLAPLFALIVMIQDPRQRFLCAVVLFGGLCATVSKQGLVVIIPILVWLSHEGFKKSLMYAAILFVLVLGVVFFAKGSIVQPVESFVHATVYRYNSMDDSISVRTGLIEEAMNMAAECSFLGYGVEGSHTRMMGRADHDVHVYFLGVALISGLPGMLAVIWGFVALTWGIVRAQQPAFLVMIMTYSVILCTQTVLLLSAQSLPIMVAGAIVSRKYSARAQTSLASNTWAVQPRPTAS